ncbi:arsenate reductase family protein [Paenirhodobacter populi]|uniref:Arsenate reductase n=1 Tax=Paenirhodobacter populi TaxID=2306993 RepID=A0A443J1N4_9RHOB|nr:ArsC/Spx/MgsR family protein [Sinirhodobacter populi]RWR14340.1 hypothetical protein D2T33_03775 [Sinirhodobacter populi]
MILYGIPTCDTCRKAKKALEAAGQAVTFRDVRAEPLTPDEIGTFLAAFGDRLVNRASTTWRGLSETERAETPEALLAAHPALMKRPVLRSGDRLTLGWDAKTQAEWL